MFRLFAVMLLAASCGVAQTCKIIPVDATDGVTASPANHKVVFENNDVRVIEVSSLPHTEEKIHTHARPALLYTDQASTGLLTRPPNPPISHVPPADGKPRLVFLPPDEPHFASNIGDTPFHALRVELKHPGCRLDGGSPVAPGANDALTAAPQNHMILFENADVRVLDVSVAPHSTEAMHTHVWPSVFYIDQIGNVRNHTAGSDTVVTIPAGAKLRPLFLAPEGLHSVENVGGTPFHAIRIELKMGSAK